MKEKEKVICPFCQKEGEIESRKIISLGTIWGREKKKKLKSNYKCEHCGKRCVIYSPELLNWDNPEEVGVALEIAVVSLRNSLGAIAGSQVIINGSLVTVC